MSDRLTNKTTLLVNLPEETLLAVARRCLEEGARVITASGKPFGDPLESGTTPVVTHDPTDTGAWQRLGEQIVARFGGLDILVQGLTAHHAAPLTDTTLEQFRTANERNLEATFLATQMAFRAMRRRGGAIVNVSSAWAALGAANSAALCAGAGGLRMLTKAAGVEGVTGDVKIRVNCILAGNLPDLPAPPGVRAAPLGVAEPTALLDAIVFLASDDSAYMTGAMLPLDGGLTAS